VIEPQVYVSEPLHQRFLFPGTTVGWNSPTRIPTDMCDAAFSNAHDVPNYVNRLNLPWPGNPQLALRHLDRFRGVSYPEVVSRIEAMVQQDPISRLGAMVVIDGTGVGRAVVDLFRQTDLNVAAISIHGGDAVGRGGGYIRVPKRDLVAAVQSALQTKRLEVAEGLPLLPVLRTELQGFKIRIDPRTAHDSYSHWREGDHDDLVIATAMAIWFRDWTWRSGDRSRMEWRDDRAA